MIATSRAKLTLIGGDKTGQDRYYQEYIRLVDILYDTHLLELEMECMIR